MDPGRAYVRRDWGRCEAEVDLERRRLAAHPKVVDLRVASSSASVGKERSTKERCLSQEKRGVQCERPGLSDVISSYGFITCRTREWNI